MLTHTHTQDSYSEAKSQSAMEYLMTYGWAILIIAVVLGVMFQLGVFSGGSLTPKAQPGACTVQRLAGQVSLEGLCQGQLPEYIGWFSGSTTRNTITVTSPTVSNTIFTVSVWFYPTSTSQISGLAYFGSISGSGWGAVASPNAGTGGCSGGLAYSVYVLQSGMGWFCVPSTYNLNKWNYFALVGAPASGNHVQYSFYLNGNVLQTNVNTPFIPIGNFTIGATAEGDPFIGGISNVQVYNTTLSASEIQALYNDGIGGAPIKIQNLVGWWPLNGNTNDYSGYNNNAHITGGVSFNGTWQSAYTAP